MDRYFAKQLLNEGFAIRHRTFLPEEFIRKNENGQLQDESGVAIDESEFWRHRDSEIFADGWEVAYYNDDEEDDWQPCIECQNEDSCDRASLCHSAVKRSFVR
jgi:hypothetical protein